MLERRALAWSFVVSLALIAPPLPAQVGLDASFGSGGVAGAFAGTSVSGVSLALQADGRILLGGFRDGTGGYAVARLLADGSLDPSFGSGGVAGTFAGHFEGSVSLALQTDGRILLGGWRSGSGDYAVARLLPGGSLDPDFGSGGVAGTFAGSPFGGVSVAVQADGRILLGGFRSGPSDYAVARLLADGSLDPSFGSGGVTGTFAGHSSAGASLALQTDGRILLGGWRFAGFDYAVARLLPGGSLDPTFGSGGVAATFAGAPQAAVSLALQADGRILLGGWRNGSNDYAVARLLVDGALDPTFGSGGVAATFAGFSFGGVSLALQADGRILLGGWRNGPGDYAVARLLADGSLDSTFGSGGVAGAFAGFPEAAASVAVQADGRILLGGSRSGANDHAVARLTGPVGFGDRVWIDADADGLQDPGEPGAPNVLVLLRDLETQTVADAAVTGADGSFAVGGALPPAGLELLPDPLSSYSTFTRMRVGTDRAIDSDAAPNGLTGLLQGSIGAVRDDVDAGLVPADLIGDLVWSDLDGDGIQGPGEPGLAGLALELLDGAGAVLATALASPYGHYAFAERPADSYRLRLLVPPGLALTLPDQGGLDGLDSDFDPATGLSPPFSYAGGFQLSLDAGLLVPAAWLFADGFETASTVRWSAAVP
jgi:uncharacterized delta-60 repeat protein